VNWRQFTVALVQALAWPSIVLVVLLAYRQRIAQLLGDNLRRLTVGPLAAEWDRVAETAQATIEAAEALPALRADSTEPPGRQVLAVARLFVQLNTRTAIIYGWQAASEAFDEHLPVEDEELSQLRPAGRLLKRARERGLIKPAAAFVFEQLQNLVFLAHPGLGRQEPTIEQAEAYLRLVDEFLGLLDRSAEAGV
jgi:hypothetical protein